MSVWQYLWVKVVAKAWNNEDFKKELLHGDARAVIMNHFPEVKMFPLPSWVDLYVKEPDPRPPWIEDISYWILPPNDLVWKLPAPHASGFEAAVELADFASKLARFSFGYTPLIPPDTDTFPKIEANAGEDPTTGFDTTVTWTLRWPEAVALAWKNHHFREALLRNPSVALSEAFAIEVPPSTHLIVEESYAAPKAHPAGLAQLTMYLPPKPPEQDAALAIGEYLASGTSNPFTLCI